MKYLTREEITSSHREEARDVLEHCLGKSVRDRFAMELFDRWHDRFYRDREHTKILDLGTGNGFFPLEIAKSGYTELYACDVDDYRSPEAKTLFKDFRVVDLSWEKLPWPDATFDMITAWCILPHLENPFHAVREITRVLRPGGFFIFTTPYLASRPSRSFFQKYGDFRSYHEKNNHIVLFPHGVVKKTIFKYLGPVDVAYHARLWKIFRGPRGIVRKILYHVARVHPSWQRYLEQRWSYNVAYLVGKSADTGNAKQDV